MKIITLITTILMALYIDHPNENSYDYDKAWKDVEKSINDGLPKSALTKVEEIFKVADAENNDPQYAKCIIYIARLSIQTDEKGIENAIARLETVIKNINRPSKYIAASYLAELYQRYFDSYRWEISQRSEIEGQKSNDFRTWTTQQFISTIEQWYQYSLENKKAINIPIETYKVVLNKYDREAILFRPTLYEVLADRIFAFYRNYENLQTLNIESFQIDQEWFFSDYTEYISKSIAKKDINDPLLRTISLYQDVMNTQMQTNNKSALIEYDLSRLEFVYRNAILDNKKSLYRKSLENLAQSAADHDLYTKIIAKTAHFLRAEPEFDIKNSDIIKLCENAIKKHPNSNGAKECQNIISDIKKPMIQIYGEQVYPSKHPILYAIDHKNIGHIKIEIVKLDPDFGETINTKNQDEIKKYLLKAKKTKTIKHVFKANPEYKTEKTELFLESLSYGHYALLAHDQNASSQIFQYIVFQISDLAYTTYHSDNKRMVIVTDRMTGLPKKGVNVALFAQNYNPGNRKFEFIRTGAYTTNHDGKITITERTDQNIKFVLSDKKDVLDINQYHYNYKRYEQSENRFADFFTDRSIYRPGQIVYFKAILLKNDKNQIPSIISGENIEVVLRDANYQEVAQQKYKSNEFGSINGSFAIPSDRLTGMYTLSIQSSNGIGGQKVFNVEEYKRPSFEVLMTPLVGEYKLTDNIKVTGKAQTLAGSPVDGGLVKYKVVRNVRYPVWGWWWRLPYPSEEFIVKQGECISKNDGSFDVEFDVLPDLKVDKKTNPIFHYRIDVDVTDQRGETRTTQADLSAGYYGFSLSSNLTKNIDLGDLKPLQIIASNHNGQKIDAHGQVKISLLQAPKNVQVNKYWEGKIDFPLPRNISEKLFPHFPSSPETDYSKWPISKQVLSRTFNTNDSIDLSKILTYGVFKIELESIDHNKNKVTTEQYIVVTNFSKNLFPTSEYMFFKLNHTTLEPGQLLKLELGASEKPVFAQYFIEKDGKLLEDKIVKVDKYAALTLPVLESYRGGIHIKVAYVMSNRTFQHTFQVNVPWTNKQLLITYETFRDKTLPGSHEEYRIKITGKNKEKIAAELVAAMYDASLDQFADYKWRTDFYPQSYSTIHMETPGFYMVNGRYYDNVPASDHNLKHWTYPELIPLVHYYGGRGQVFRSKAMNAPDVMEYADRMIPSAQPAPQAENATPKKSDNIETKENTKIAEEAIPLRKNLKETVFFYPEMKTDSEGNVILSFTMNEALTKWKLMTFAHTTDFKYGYDERFVRTQKNLMIFPNAPRFVRDGDKITFAAKVTNMTNTILSGHAILKIYDAISMSDITAELVKSSEKQHFTLNKGLSQGLEWEMVIPQNKYQSITYRITAEGDGHTDGEENTIPVITNSVLVTETMPIWIRGKENKSFVFNAFKDNFSQTKKDFKYTFEFTSNPVWYAIQALPYMSSVNHAGTQSLIDRYYTNALASGIANAHPKIKAVFDQWQIKYKDALISNLSKNQELKDALIEETPWILQSLSEAEQKRNIAILFDINKMADEKAMTIKKLSERQLSNGGFPWFPGGRDDVYTTQNIMENIGHLRFLGLLDEKNPEMDKIISSTLGYMDIMLADRYNKLKADVATAKGNLNDDHLDELAIHYLYVKTFFRHVQTLPVVNEARNYYFEQAKKYWNKRSISIQAMIGLVMHRNEEKLVASIIKSLRERSFSSDEMGMYWNEGNGFHWFQLPVERQALLIELFSEAADDTNKLDQMKISLLKNKQTNHWKTSKSTASAIYALLIKGENNGISSWVTESSLPEIIVGKDNLKAETSSAESGIGYFKKSYTQESISKELANIKINNTNKSIAWAAVYYQYFEQSDKIKSFADTPLKLSKTMYKVIRTATGDKLEAITSSTELHPGDKIKIRIELRVDRNMEYVHMKDMRASGIEPENVISSYKYQGQLGYYEATKDMATHFYFSYLPKGTFVFEYPAICVNKGDFSAGIASIESMYAPEFKSHSEGQKIKIK